MSSKREQLGMTTNQIKKTVPKNLKRNKERQKERWSGIVRK